MTFKKTQHLQIVNSAFTNLQAFEQFTDEQLAGCAWFFFDRMSIQYPNYVEALQRTGTNQAHAVRTMGRYVNRMVNGRQPKWSYTRGGGIKKKLSKDLIHLGDENKEAYCKVSRITMVDINDLLKYYPEVAEKNLREFYDAMNPKK